MRTIATLLLASVVGLSQAQTINNATINPPNPTECTLLDVVINITLPSSGELLGYTPGLSGDTITVTASGSGGTGGSSPQTIELPGLGPFPPGNYTLCVPLIYNGVEVDEFCQDFTIGDGVNPNAGEYGELGICNSAANFNLITVLGGTPTPGGVWYNPSNVVVPGGTFDPGQSPEGFYTYVWNVVDPCIDANQQVLVYYLPNNSSGLNATVQVCATGDTLVDLFSELGGSPTPGGAWTFGGNATDGTVQPGVDACGIYTYTVQGIAPCGAASSTINIQCVQPANAGADITVLLCANDSVENFNTLLQGEQPGGQWFNQDGFFIAPFNGNISVALYGFGEYYYRVVSPVCGMDESVVTVQNCVGIEELGGNLARMELAPNPANDLVMLEVELAREGGDHQLELVDARGAVVRSERLAFNGLLARRTMDLVGLSKGVYMVRLSSAEGQALRRLVVK